MQVTVLREIPEDREVVDSWNSLAARMECPEIFFTCEWALAASRAFADTKQPLVFLVYDTDRLCGVAALATRLEQPATAFFLAASTADYCDVLSEPARRGEVLASVFGSFPKLGLRHAVLANLPSDSPTLRELPKVAKSSGFHFYSRAAYECGLIVFGDEVKRQAVLQETRRKGREKRGLKKMAQMGPVHLTHLTGEQRELDLTLIVSAQITRFLAPGRVSPLGFPERRSFLAVLTRLLG